MPTKKNESSLWKSLEELSEVAELLNSKSNLINKLITEFESRLASMNIGLEVWLGNYPLWEGPTSNERGEFGSEQHNRQRVLGYGRLNERSGWGLLVKECVMIHGFFEGDTSSPYAYTTDETEPKELISVSREDRLKAIERFESLVETLADKANEAVKSIKKAESFLK